jgi:hypothetical protein
MKPTLEAINQMQADGVIDEYAIGGAVGATFYLESAATADLDVFVVLPSASGLLISRTPIYEYLKSLGGKVQDEYIVIGGWPVQFLPAANQLEQEAIRDAISGGTATSKPKLRARLASLSFSEKVKILERLRDREKAIAAAGLRRKTAKDTPSTK